MVKRRTYTHWLRAMRDVLELVWAQSQSGLMAEEMGGIDCQGRFGALCPGRKEKR